MTTPDGSAWFTENAADKIGHIKPNGDSVSDEFTSLGATRPDGITVGPGGNLWVTFEGPTDPGSMGAVAAYNQSGSLVGSVIATGADTRPSAITPSLDGSAVWFIEPGTAKVAKVTAAGVYTEPTTLPAGATPTAITTGSDGSLWVTAFGGGGDRVYHIDASSGAIVETRTLAAGSHPTDIARDATGSLWVTLNGTDKIAKLLPQSGGGTAEYTLPANAGPTSIARGADGALWFLEDSRRVGRIDLAGHISEFTGPSITGPLTEIAPAPGGDFWITAQQANSVVHLDPSQLISVTPSAVSATVHVPIPATQVVASFTSSEVGASAASFSATIDWGDGSPVAAGTVQAEGAGFVVQGGHTYATAGAFSIHVQVTDHSGLMAPLATSSATVAGETISVTASPITATANAAFSQVVATFTTNSTNTTASDYKASIDWGDNTPASLGAIRAVVGGFEIEGGHTYTKAGTFPVKVTVSDTGGTSVASASSTATVTSPALTVTASPVSATTNVAFTQVAATFTTTAANPIASNYSASIDWGDGTPAGNGTVRGVAGGFEILGSHVYVQPGSYPIKVTVSGTSGVSTATASSTATVVGAGAVSGALAPFSDSGVPNDEITNVDQPTFLGKGTPYAIVQAYGVRAAVPTQTRYLGQAIVNANGDWSLVSAMLPDGSYTVTATMTVPGGSPTAPVVIAPNLMIDTIAPRVAGFDANTATHTVTVVLSDVGSGVYGPSALNPNNYTIVPPYTIAGRNPGASVGKNPGISGFYSSADAMTVDLDLMSSVPGRKRWLFQVTSGGVTDVAGNILDGEFTGSLPSGNGAPGGNFLLRLVTRTPFKSALRTRRVAPLRTMGQRTHHHR